MVLLFFAVIVTVFALVKGQYKFMLMGVEAGLYGSAQELLLIPEWARYSLWLELGGQLCLLALALTAIWFAAGKEKKDEA